MIMLPLELVIGSEFLALILTGGAAAMVTALVQAYRSIKEGSKAEDRDAFAEIENSRKTEARLRSRAEVERDYWHRRAAVLEYTVISVSGPAGLPAREPFPEDEETSG